MISVYEQLQTIGFGTVFMVVLLLISFTPMLIKAWKEFLEQLGLKSVSQLNDENQDNSIKDLDNRVTELDQAVAGLGKDVSDILNQLHEMKDDRLADKIDEYHFKIIDFADALSNGKICSMEKYNHIFEINGKYEKVLEENNLTNGQTEESMKYIRKCYHKMLDK